MIRRFLTALPVYAVLADLVYGLALNVKDALLPSAAPAPKDGLPVSPEFAFGWIQVLANGGMVLVVGWALAKLLLMRRAAAKGSLKKLDGSGVFALLAAVAFALPGLWNGAWALASLLQGWETVWFGNPRYLAVALCQPWILLLCVQVWRGRPRRIRHNPSAPLPRSFSEVRAPRAPSAGDGGWREY